MSRLQAHLAGRILTHMREQGIGAGAWLSENALAHVFGVSRTPVRGALAELSRLGILGAVPRKGYVLKRAISEQDLQGYSGAADDDERIIERMAADRLAAALPDQVSETDLLRRYQLTRRVLGRVLNRMAQDSVIERRSGNGWRFLPALDSAQMHAESYRFRELIEPASLLEPTFRLDRARAQRLRAAHVELLAGGLRQLSARGFLDLDVEFHEFIAACSGNRFLEQAVIHQSHLRRFFSYLVSHDPQRARVACSEHVAILDRMLAGELDSAAALLRRHLFNMSQYRPRAAVR
ncbi:MAG: GntR family transcriptional regulator [Sinobacteraceae bacterium]|nr:GntR family transcriptional regulator [Nevskiaceae bacterium]